MQCKNYIGSLKPAVIEGGYRDSRYWIWCGSVIHAPEDGRYYMFASRWEKKYGFSNNWLYRSKIVLCSSDTPEGPYHYEQTVLPPRSADFFDGRNTHNPYVRYYNGRYYLYYMGTTYGGPEPCTSEELGNPQRFIEAWNQKRIGLATAASIHGPWVRRDKPILLPRGCSHWDCTATTNPAVAILPNGKTYMLYKSRSYAGATLQIGVAAAESPDGEFKRLTEKPILTFDNTDFHVEDPYLWYQDGKFRMLIKDDFKNNSGGITGDWGSGFYAESEDCIHWTIPENPQVYSRHVLMSDGNYIDFCNTERPFLLLEGEIPTHLFLAVGAGKNNVPYQMTESYNLCIPLNME